MRTTRRRSLIVWGIGLALFSFFSMHLACTCVTVTEVMEETALSVEEMRAEDLMRRLISGKLTIYG